MFGKVFVLFFFLGAMYLVAQAQLAGVCYFERNCLSYHVAADSFVQCCEVLRGLSHRPFNGICRNW